MPEQPSGRTWIEQKPKGGKLRKSIQSRIYDAVTPLAGEKQVYIQGGTPFSRWNHIQALCVFRYVPLGAAASYHWHVPRGVHTKPCSSLLQPLLSSHRRPSPPTSFDRTLSACAAPALAISAGSLHLQHVMSGNGNRVQIVGHVHVRSGWISSGGDEDRVKQIVANPPILQSGDTISIGQTR